MANAEYIKMVEVTVPAAQSDNDQEITLEIYKDMRTGYYIGIDSSFLQRNHYMNILSPYDQKLRLVIS